MKESKSNNQRKSQSHDPEIEVLMKTIFETKLAVLAVNEAYSCPIAMQVLQLRNLEMKKYYRRDYVGHSNLNTVSPFDYSSIFLYKFHYTFTSIAFHHGVLGARDLKENNVEDTRKTENWEEGSIHIEDGNEYAATVKRATPTSPDPIHNVYPIKNR
uniref:Uncharacterized protein n=1 Tax=Salix viminalis TaxID=40686 RepID=A0A6N2KTW6_SALVM